jgi:predicted lipid-binding transport protein (Tim44 family)
MNKKILKIISIATVVLFMSIFVFELDAFARVGGGTSSGSRGSRSYSPPSRSYSQPAPSKQQAAPVQPASAVQPAGGSFLRTMGGALIGGLIGGMLFSGLGFAGQGGFGGSGIGLIEIILVLGISYLIFRMIKKRKEENLSYQTASQQRGYQTEKMPAYESSGQSYKGDTSVDDEGISHIRQMDPYFDEARFKDMAMDSFFKIQGAWMNRNLSPASNLLTDEIRGIFQKDIDILLREKKVNRLENIAVRNVEIVETWQESGQDFITVLFQANLLDYTTDDSTGKVVAGSKEEPVKFEEYWTFTRTVGNNPWRLSAINQQ